MAYQDQVVDFRAAADARFAYRGAVDARVGLNLDIILQNSRTGLDHFVPRAVVLLGEAQAVATDNHAVLEDDAVADPAVLADYRVGVSKEVIADFGATINRDETMQDRVLAKLGFFIDEAVRSDVRAFGDSGGAGDDGGRVDPWFVARWLVEKLNGMGEG